MAIDTRDKRASAIASRRLPWMRRFAFAPDGSLTQPDRQHLGYAYRGIAASGESPVTIADLSGVTNRRVYDVPLAMGTVSSDGEVETYLNARSLNPELDDFHWSALSVATHFWDTDQAPDAYQYTHSVPVTLISDSWGIVADHNYPRTFVTPDAPARVWFRGPDGTLVIGTVATEVGSEIILTSSKARLIQFTAPLSGSLARLPIVNDASLEAYAAANGKAWLFYQDLTLKLRELVSLPILSGIHYSYHADSDWDGGTITQGSSRPAVVPLSNGTLVLIGTMISADHICRLSADIAQIQAALAETGESATTMDLPGYESGSAINIRARARSTRTRSRS